MIWILLTKFHYGEALPSILPTSLDDTSSNENDFRSVKQTSITGLLVTRSITDPSSNYIPYIKVENIGKGRVTTFPLSKIYLYFCCDRGKLRNEDFLEELNLIYIYIIYLNIYLELFKYPERQKIKKKYLRNNFEYNMLYFYQFFDAKFKLEETRELPLA